MDKFHYRTQGQLVEAIPTTEGVAKAQEYLTSDDMTKYMDESIAGVLFHIQWALHSDGLNWHVDAYATRKLTDDELRVLSEWVSGQNSDGLGEGFEQQDWAWVQEDCGECGYNSGYGCECGQGRMCSFDWQTNDCKFELVTT